VILKTFIKRKNDLGLIELRNRMFDDMIQYNLVDNHYEPDIIRMEAHERPPIVDIPAYRKKFSVGR
jgi:glucosyl-3-phosphoglycerate synthase